ncbi:type II CAAX prenyl endopeptidase Rce1 family protein [Paratractidigestivibacter sp.]|uniref:CPBP family glutamic-type intramembrane protease n=1 Tax=Paratractidigestivibacter sp. TaxID=2847316 RepID=UPI002AC8E3D2|nr:CPBP family glutamic-type intramembrane protease [Paratractidigestivibacter sp.]
MAEKPELEKDGSRAPGKVSVLRWIGFLAADYLSASLVATLFIGPLDSLSLGEEWSWLPSTLSNFLTFALLFFFAVLYLQLICKMSLRALLFGAEGSPDWAQAAKIILVYLVGYVVSTLISSRFGAELELNTIGPIPIFVNLLVVASLTWMQTTWEELVFRGIFLRWSCGEKIAPTLRCVIAGLVSSLLFMWLHGSNPEVLSQSGIDVAVAFSIYFLAGASLYFFDVAFGDAMAGCAVHWINNFVGFALINQVGTVVVTGALVIDHTPVAAAGMLVYTAICYIPVYLYIAYLAKKGALPRR